MTCSRCQNSFEAAESRCPHCGKRNPKLAGVLKTSTVLISAQGSEGVYRSVEDVPAPLRKRLLKSTSSPDSRTILIADSKGRVEIDKAIQRLPGAAQKRLLDAEDSPDPMAWFTPSRRKWIMAVVFLVTLAFIAAVFLYRWK